MIGTLMVGVAEPDRDVLRFLWVDDPTSEVVVKHFNRVVNGGKDNDSEAFELYSKARSRMRDGGFNLRKWISSH